MKDDATKAAPSNDEAAGNEPIVHVVDDNKDARETLRDHLQSLHLKTVIYDDGHAFLDLIDPKSFGCIVLDLRMPSIGGLAILGTLTDRYIQTPVIILSGHVDVVTAVRAMKTGCFDVIEKGSSMEQLLDAIQRAVAKDRERHLTDRAKVIVVRREAQLTPREREVMEQVVKGLRNKEIAAELGISVGTVEIHRGRLMRKMGANSVADLVNMAAKRPTAV